jgi:signal transduction histidine kinase
LQLYVHIEKPLPRIFGHSDGLRHLFYNLLDNAFQYTGEGGEVKFQLGADPSGQRIQGEVSDTGIGIPSECLPYIFDEFYRAPNVKKRGIEGSGLGLNIVQWVIHAHQGEIKVKSEEGRGTSFYFALPVGGPQGKKAREDEK